MFFYQIKFLLTRILDYQRQLDVSLSFDKRAATRRGQAHV